jgi:hypothetical protein
MYLPKLSFCSDPSNDGASSVASEMTRPLGTPLLGSTGFRRLHSRQRRFAVGSQDGPSLGGSFVAAMPPYDRTIGGELTTGFSTIPARLSMGGVKMA